MLIQQSGPKIGIIGGGVSGAALAFTLAKFSNARQIDVFEKDNRLAAEASDGHSNSQTLHSGDIETNYPLEKAKEVKRKADRLARYCEQFELAGKILHKGQKMALGVGDTEVEFMLSRYEQFRHLYPDLEIFNKEKLSQIEPGVIFNREGQVRPENMIGIGILSGYTTIDFRALTESLMQNAMSVSNKGVHLHLGTKVSDIQEKAHHVELMTAQGVFDFDYVVVNAGAYSLMLAHQMGYGLDLGVLPVAGGFFMAKKKILNGKVYMVQNPKLPFAALHGDPDLLAEGRTRLGPTAVMFPPKLERNAGLKSTIDSLISMRPDPAAAKIIGGLLLDPEVRDYILRNILYGAPLLGKYLFLQDARKIIPALEWGDIEKAKGFGGVRPQIINKTTGELQFGDASIQGSRILFNFTPSPGATSAIDNARRDALVIQGAQGLDFDLEKFFDFMG